MVISPVCISTVSRTLKVSRSASHFLSVSISIGKGSLLGAALSGASSSTEISGIVMINSDAADIASAPIRKTSFKPLSRSGALFCARPRMAGATAIPIIWKKKIAPTATPNRRLGTENCATSVLTVGMIPRPNPAREVMSTYSQIGVLAEKRHIANKDRVTMG